MQTTPNILLILAEDHGQWATGCRNNREVRTPNLDYLAISGVKFAHAFTPALSAHRRGLRSLPVVSPPTMASTTFSPRQAPFCIAKRKGMPLAGILFL